MKIENIKEMLEWDKSIDYTQLDTASLKIPEQAVKYQQLSHDEAGGCITWVKLQMKNMRKNHSIIKF